MNKTLKNLLPIGFIILIWLIFASPYFFQHKIPFPSLYAVNAFTPWSAYHMYDGPIKNGAMPDVITQIYPWKYFTIESWKHGQIPLWNPYSFSGTPHLANYQSAVLTPLNVLFFIFPFVDAWSLLILLQPLLAGVFTYLYCRSLHISKIGSLIASIGFMFCGFITTWMDYGTLGYAILFLPLALCAVEQFVHTDKIRYVVLLSFSIPLSFFSGHFQISLYFFLFVILYIAYKAFTKKNILNTIFLILYTLFGLLLSMPQILPSLEFYNLSLRSNLFQQIEAIPLGYLPTLLAPDFFGNPVTRNDWFGHYAEWNGYIGLLPLMLGIYAIFSAASKAYTKQDIFDRTKKSFVMFLTVVSIILLLFAFDTPILHLLIALHIPVLSTSAASRIIVLFSFCFVVLAGFGFDALHNDIKSKQIKPIITWLSGFLIIFLFLWSIVFLKLLLPADKITIAKQNLTLPTILLLLSIGIVTAIVIFHRFSKPSGKDSESFQAYTTLFPTFLRPELWTMVCFLLLTSFDLLRFATKWQPFDPRQFVFPQTPVTQNFKQKEPYQRIYGNYGANISMYNHLPAVDGYDPLYIERYGEFIGSQNGTFAESLRSVVSFPQNAKYIPQALKLLDISHIIQKNSDNGLSWGFPFAQYPLSQFTPIYNDGSYTIYKNNVLTYHVFLAKNYQIRTKPQDILQTLFHNANFRNTLVLEKDPHLSQDGVAGNAQIQHYSANAITISTATNHPALLFLSEVFYPGWHAYVDGKSTEIYRTDYAFRSIVLPTGKHIVEFKYEPESFTIGLWLSLLGIISIIGLPFIYKPKLLQ